MGGTKVNFFVLAGSQNCGYSGLLCIDVGKITVNLLDSERIFNLANHLTQLHDVIGLHRRVS